MGRKAKAEEDKRITLTITVPREFIKKLEERAKKKGYSNRSAMIKEMLETYMQLVDKREE